MCSSASVFILVHIAFYVLSVLIQLNLHSFNSSVVKLVWTGVQRWQKSDNMNYHIFQVLKQIWMQLIPCWILFSHDLQIWTPPRINFWNFFNFLTCLLTFCGRTCQLLLRKVECIVLTHAQGDCNNPWPSSVLGNIPGDFKKVHHALGWVLENYFLFRLFLFDLDPNTRNKSVSGISHFRFKTENNLNIFKIKNTSTSQAQWTKLSCYTYNVITSWPDPLKISE